MASTICLVASTSSQRILDSNSLREQSLHLSTKTSWRVQNPTTDGGHNRSTPGAVPLAKTFKCKFVAQTTLLSSSEPLAGTASAANGSAAADEEAAFGEPSSCLHNNKVFVLDQVRLVAATNALLSNSNAPTGCRQASRVQAGRPGAGRNKAVAHRMCSDVRACTSMCPPNLNQDQKSVIKVYTGMYSVYTSIYFI